jgi:hypothetical protein
MTAPAQIPHVLEALLEAIDEVNAILPDSEKLERRATLALHGSDSRIESITLINLLVAAEERLAARFGKSPPLTTLIADVDPARYATLNDLAHLTAEALA